MAQRRGIRGTQDEIFKGIVVFHIIFIGTSDGGIVFVCMEAGADR